MKFDAEMFLKMIKESFSFYLDVYVLIQYHPKNISFLAGYITMTRMM